MKNIETKGTGLVCEHCGWKDETIAISDFGDWVDKPCPKCGKNLLTQAQYNEVILIMEAVEMVNKMSPEQIEEMTKNLTVDQQIDAYEKLKELGIKQKEPGSETFIWGTKK